MQAGNADSVGSQATKTKAEKGVLDLNTKIALGIVVSFSEAAFWGSVPFLPYTHQEPWWQGWVVVQL